MMNKYFKEVIEKTNDETPEVSMDEKIKEIISQVKESGLGEITEEEYKNSLQFLQENNIDTKEKAINFLYEMLNGEKPEDTNGEIHKSGREKILTGLLAAVCATGGFGAGVQESQNERMFQSPPAYEQVVESVDYFNNSIKEDGGTKIIDWLNDNYYIKPPIDSLNNPYQMMQDVTVMNSPINEKPNNPIDWNNVETEDVLAGFQGAIDALEPFSEAVNGNEYLDDAFIESDQAIVGSGPDPNQFDLPDPYQIDLNDFLTRNNDDHSVETDNPVEDLGFEEEPIPQIEEIKETPIVEEVTIPQIEEIKETPIVEEPVSQVEEIKETPIVEEVTIPQIEEIKGTPIVEEVTIPQIEEIKETPIVEEVTIPEAEEIKETPIVEEVTIPEAEEIKETPIVEEVTIPEVEEIKETPEEETVPQTEEIGGELDE